MSLPPSSSLHILFISKLSKWLIKIIYLRCDVRVKIVIRDPLADLLLVVLLVVLLPDQPCKDIWGACLLLSFVSHFFLSLGTRIRQQTSYEKGNEILEYPLPRTLKVDHEQQEIDRI
jgi:hypothetical protein